MNNLDNFYNKKLQNREFEFKDSYWEDAERLIVEDEKNRRSGRYFWIFGLLLICIVGGAALWFGTSNPVISNPEVTEESTVASKIAFEEQTAIVKTQPQSIQKPNDQSSKSENNLSELSVIASNSSDNEIENSNPVTVKNDSKDNPVTQTSGNEISNSTKPKNTKKVNSHENSLPIITTEKLDKPFQNDEIATDQLKNEVSENASKDIVSEEIASVSLLAPITTLPDEIDAPEYPKLKKISHPKTKKFKFGLTASSLFYPATNNEKLWIGASFGLVGQYRFLKRMSLNTELLYTFRTGTFGTTSKSNQTLFGFGKQTVEYSSNPENIHFLELPIYVQYHLGRHGIEGGLSFSYLFGVNGNIEKETSLQPWERTGGNNVSSENYFSGWLSKEGFNAFNTSFILGYKYAINQSFALGFRSAYRFGELVKVQDNSEKALLESGPLNFNISATWFILK